MTQVRVQFSGNISTCFIYFYIGYIDYIIQHTYTCTCSDIIACFFLTHPCTRSLLQVALDIYILSASLMSHEIVVFIIVVLCVLLLDEIST